MSSKPPIKMRVSIKANGSLENVPGQPTVNLTRKDWDTPTAPSPQALISATAPTYPEAFGRNLGVLAFLLPSSPYTFPHRM